MIGKKGVSLRAVVLRYIRNNFGKFSDLFVEGYDAWSNVSNRYLEKRCFKRFMKLGVPVNKLLEKDEYIISVYNK